MGCFAIILFVLGALFFGVSSGATPPPEANIAPIPVVPVPIESTINYAKIPQGRTEDGAFILGYDDAAITIVAFEDFLCPHCQNYQPVIQEFIKEYVVTGQARFEFRMLPISQMSPTSFGLVECSDELSPNSFWNAHDTLFHLISTSAFDPGNSPSIFAEMMNLDYDDLSACLETADQYQIDMALALEYGEITGTPSVGWRLNDGELRFDGISRRPTVDDIGALIRSAYQ